MRNKNCFLLSNGWSKFDELQFSNFASHPIFYGWEGMWIESITQNDKPNCGVLAFETHISYDLTFFITVLHNFYWKKNFTFFEEPKVFKSDPTQPHYNPIYHFIICHCYQNRVKILKFVWMADIFLKQKNFGFFFIICQAFWM